jgi:hypothetical protein
MKTTVAPFRVPPWNTFWLVLVPFLPTAVAAADRTTGPASADASATHVLFMGVELAAEKGRAYHPVVGVTAASVVIAPEGKPVRLPLAQTANLRVTETLRLADAKVGLDHFKFERAYSADADPSAQLARTAALAASQTAFVDLANADLRRANLQVAGASGAVAGASNPEDMADARRALNSAQSVQASAEANLNQALATPNSQVYDVGAQSARLSGEENYDAIRVSFAVTAESDLAQPYCGIIARLRDPGTRSDRVRPWVYLHPLSPMLAGETRRVTVFQSGFPPGYTLEGCDVHVYDGAKELATPLSPRRVPLSDEEAREYRVIEYIAANRGRTLPAALITTALRLDAWASLNPAQLKETCHVRVAKDGRVTGTFRDADGKKPLADAALAAVLKTLRYNPALVAGQPVESIVPVVLGGLAVR